LEDKSKDLKQLEDIVKRDNLGLINDSDSIESNIDNQGYETHRGLIENANYDQEEQFENASNKSD
jgi:hypothetical protein